MSYSLNSLAKRPTRSVLTAVSIFFRFENSNIVLESENPTWASINNGVFICRECTLTHKEWNSVQVSRVRSIQQDTWTEFQLKFMILGGNKFAAEYYAAVNLNEESAKTRYSAKEASEYRQALGKKVDPEATHSSMLEA